MKMKIGLLNDSFPPLIDGVANTVKAYADNLCQEDEPVVITPKYPHVNDNYPYEVYRYHSIPTDKILGYRSGDPFGPLSVTELINKKFDILHVHCPFASAVLALNLKSLSRSRLPVVFTYHTKFDVDIVRLVPTKAFQKFVVKFVVGNISRMDEVWVVSSGAGQNLRSLGYKGAYRVMPNGTDFAKGRSSDDTITALKKKHGIEEDEFVFLFVGRMMWYKNIGLIVDSMKRLKNQGVKFKTIMVGHGDDLYAVEQYVDQLELSDRFIFTGAVYDREELRTYYSAADLFLFPSTYDTSGLVVKEAAACNCPSVLVRESCASEGVEHQQTGFLCDETIDSCTEVILDAISDRDRLKRIGEGAGEKVYFSWKDSVEAARKRYAEIIESKHTKRRFWGR